MNYFFITIEQIGIFIIYALIGVIAVKGNVIDRNGLDVLSRFITKIALPLLIFTNTINGTTRQEFLNTLPVLLLTAVMYMLLYYLCFGLAKIFRLRGNEGNVYRACSMFGNIGFMGIPIIGALFPEHGLLYLALFTVVDQLLLWTVGIDLTTPVEQQSTLPAKERIKKMINPATVGILLAVMGICLNTKLPGILNTALVKTGAAATPLAMVYLGGTFTYIDIRGYLKKKEFYGTVLTKMCIFPIVISSVCRLIPWIDTEIAITMGILTAMPGMSSVAMLAQSQKSAGEYGAGMIFVTTLCSIVTLPLVCFVIG